MWHISFHGEEQRPVLSSHFSALIERRNDYRDDVSIGDVDRAQAHADAFRRQAHSCDALGSPMYRDLFNFLEAACVPGSALANRLAPADQPVHDAVPLRLAGAVHREVLESRAMSLSQHYPTVGGSPGPTFAQEFLDYVLADEILVERALTTQVQTNEVRRSVALRQAARWLHSQGWEEFTLLEVGSSAGLNLWFDCYPATWFAGLELALPRHLAVHNAPTMSRAVARAGCDLHPLDISNDEHMLRLRSFVWPDQTERHERFSAAINFARAQPLAIEAANADEWADRTLTRRNGTTVVFHSIVWQYLGSAVQTRLRDALFRHGATAEPHAPLIWLRMEPNGPLADLRATVWTDDAQPAEIVLADVGYHGESFAWRSASD